MQRTSADYTAGAPGKPAADEAQRKRRIVSVDVTGNAASAKIELDYPNAKLTDYMSLQDRRRAEDRAQDLHVGAETRLRTEEATS